MTDPCSALENAEVAVDRIANASDRARALMTKIRSNVASARIKQAAFEKDSRSVRDRPTSYIGAMETLLRQIQMEEREVLQKLRWRRIALEWLIAYYTYRWRFLRVVLVTVTVYFVYDNWVSIVAILTGVSATIVGLIYDVWGSIFLSVGPDGGHLDSTWGGL